MDTIANSEAIGGEQPKHLVGMPRDIVEHRRSLIPQGAARLRGALERSGMIALQAVGQPLAPEAPAVMDASYAVPGPKTPDIAPGQTDTGHPETDLDIAQIRKEVAQHATPTHQAHQIA